MGISKISYRVRWQNRRSAAPHPPTETNTWQLSHAQSNFMGSWGPVWKKGCETLMKPKTEECYFQKAGLYSIDCGTGYRPQINSNPCGLNSSWVLPLLPRNLGRATLSIPPVTGLLGLELNCCPWNSAMTQLQPCCTTHGPEAVLPT